MYFGSKHKRFIFRTTYRSPSDFLTISGTNIQANENQLNSIVPELIDKMWGFHLLQI
jgi:hypothetical protein